MHGYSSLKILIYFVSQRLNQYLNQDLNLRFEAPKAKHEYKNDCFSLVVDIQEKINKTH